MEWTRRGDACVARLREVSLVVKMHTGYKYHLPTAIHAGLTELECADRLTNKRDKRQASGIFFTRRKPNGLGSLYVVI